MKWTVLTLMMFITTLFAIGEEAETNTANEDPGKNEYYAHYNEMENTLHTCAIPSNKMYARVAMDGHQQSSVFDRFCYYQALNNLFSRYLCQYYNLLVEKYYGQYCRDPERQPMDNTPQYLQMLKTPACKTLKETVVQEVQSGVNKPVFASIEECEAVCQQSLFCTNLAYLTSIFQSSRGISTANTSGGGAVLADGSPSGDGGSPEEGKDSGADSLPGVPPGEREGEEEKNIPAAVIGETKSGDELEDDKNDNGDTGVEGDNGGAEVKDSDPFNGIHLNDNIPPPINNKEDGSKGYPPVGDESPPQDGLPGDGSNGLPPPGDESAAQAGLPGGDGKEPDTFNDEDTGKPDGNLQIEETEEQDETKAGEDGQVTFDDTGFVQISSSESDAGGDDIQLLDDDSSDDEASKQQFYDGDGLENTVELDGQDNGDSNEQIPNVESPQQGIPQNQNAYQEEMNRLEEEEASSHFLAYSLTAIILIMVTYILYHNKQKIVAIIIEGRNAPNGKRRRYNQNVYTTVNDMA